MRFQALMPDILHWLGVKKIDRMLSMSNMKHDAIVEQGIPILERIPIPDSALLPSCPNPSHPIHALHCASDPMANMKAGLIPADSRVEIDAKINAGYFTAGKKYDEEELKQVKGRGWQGWEDIAH